MRVKCYWRGCEGNLGGRGTKTVPAIIVQQVATHDARGKGIVPAWYCQGDTCRCYVNSALCLQEHVLAGICSVRLIEIVRTVLACIPIICVSDDCSLRVPRMGLTSPGPGKNMSFTLPAPYPSIDGGNTGASVTSNSTEGHSTHPHPHEASSLPSPCGTYAPSQHCPLPVGRSLVLAA